jgi:hypothetical protein
VTPAGTEIAEPARRCPVMSRARTLATWVGEGKQVTAKAVLRRADVAAATAAIGVPDPGWVRTAADLEALHRPWVAAQACGLLSLDGDRATAARAADRDPADAWLLGLRAVLRAESHDEHRIGATVACRVVLDVLAHRPARTARELEEAVDRAFESWDYMDVLAVHQAFRRGAMPIPAAVELLAEFGAVDAGELTLTPLGSWAAPRLAEPLAAAQPPGSAVAPDQILQLKIELRYVRPPVWRRVLVPADTSLGDLHRIIQVVLAWDDDHLHVFTVDGVHVGDPFHGLEGCLDEHTVALATVLPRRRASIGYRYDLGDCWDQTVTLEKIVEPDGDATYPCCVGGRGDAPVEDWTPDCPADSIPFDRVGLNRTLAALRGSGP